MPAEHVRLPRVQELAARGAEIVDEFDATSLPRIEPLLYRESDGEKASPAPVRLVARFEESETGVASLAVFATGILPLACRRCLEAVGWPVDIEARLVLVLSDADLEGLDQRFEAIGLPPEGLNIRTVFEDELLGALPLSPAHESVGDCGELAGRLKRYDSAGDAGPERTSPFSELGAMLAADATGKDKQ